LTVSSNFDHSSLKNPKRNNGYQRHPHQSAPYLSSLYPHQVDRPTYNQSNRIETPIRSKKEVAT
jgi:hypothetical protein